jgi:hypothetical protein
MSYPPKFRFDDRPSGAPAAQAEDPLAELARLIGHRDPFAPQAAPAPAVTHDATHAAHDPGATADQFDSWFPTQPPQPHRFELPAAAHDQHEQRHETAYFSDETAESWDDRQPLADPAYGHGHAPDLHAYRDQDVPPQGARDWDDDAGQGGSWHQDGAADASDDDRHGAGALPLVPAPSAMPAPPVAYDNYRADAEPYGDDTEAGDEERERAGRGGLVTVAAVLGLAVLGTVGAFGYRAISGDPVRNGPPPVIRAEQAPAKVPAAPAPTVVQPQVGAKDERIVRREEAPVPTSEFNRQAAANQVLDPSPAANQPRVVLPGALPGSLPGSLPGAAPGGPVSVAPSTASPSSIAREPTAPPPVAVQTGALNPQRQTGAPGAAAAPAPAAPAEAKPVRTLSIRPDGQPVQTPRPPQGAQPPAQPTRRVSEPLPPAAAAPLTLSPNSVTGAPVFPAPATQAPPNSQVAALPPPAQGGAGSFVVQVTSQRTEAEAQSSFRSLQSRHSALNGYRPIIRRADLGERGTFFRAAVGPFNTREDANQLCATLRSQGGDCVVQRN